MVDLELLARRARRVSELARLRVATRMAPASLVFTLAGAVVAGALTPRVLIASALLMALIVYLRWRSRAAANGVTAGLIAGAAPIAAVFVVRALCGGDAVGECGMYCSAIGFAAGGVVTAAHAKSLRSSSGWLAAAATAVTAIAVGCAGLGLGVAAAVGVVMLAGVFVGWGVSRVVTAST